MSEDTNKEPVDNEETVQGPSELEQLKKRADVLGIKYPKNITVETLREKVNETLTPKTEKESDVKTANLTKAQRSRELRKEATKLVRVRVTCMNPNKKEWQGELFAVSNSYIGTVKKFVPFGTEWHVPQVILNMMKARQFQQFYTEKAKNGQKITKGRLVKEFSIDVLEPLTEEELKELARTQAMRGD